MASINFTVEGDQVFATGKGTFSIKDTVLKRNGAKFDGDRKCWYFSTVSFPAVKQILRAMDLDFNESATTARQARQETAGQETGEDAHQPEVVATLPLRRSNTSRHAQPAVPVQVDMSTLLAELREMRAETVALRTEVTTLRAELKDLRNILVEEVDVPADL